jgi:hypothetical protein
LRTLQRFERLTTWLLPIQLLVIMGAVGLVTGSMVAILIILLQGNVAPIPSPEAAAPAPAAVPTIPTDRIAPVFTAEVHYWSPWIMKWSKEYGVDPNILATVIQIESCGHYLVNSYAGAQGLFQVMPFHFQDGENMLDPDTNAKRGITYLIGGLELADGHIGLAMAGYNGGWGVISRGWARWARETRLYYIWGSGIYMDALAGKTTQQSEWLQSWLNAGGINLCRQAAAVLATPASGQTLAPATLAPPNFTPQETATPPVVIPTLGQPQPLQATLAPTNTLFVPTLPTSAPVQSAPQVPPSATPFMIPPTITPILR